MPRYATTQPTPVQQTTEGDSSFSSVNMKLDRSSLPTGTLALSVNKRLRKGIAETRNGIWPPVFANSLGLDAIKGIGVYSNPNGREVLLVATADTIYSMRDGSSPFAIPMTPGIALDEVEFVQAHDQIFVFRGTSETQLIWNGVDSDGFAEITKTDPLDTSTTLIPPAATAESIADRLLIISGTSDIIATDILDYVSYDAALEVFHIGREAGDTIVRVFNYAKGMAIVFCNRSTYLLLNFAGDPSLATIELLNSTLGLAGRKAVVMLGGDVLFLSNPGGIYRIAQSFESRIQTIPLPVTDPIQPFIDRINWEAASGAVGRVLGEYVYFAVPVDGSTRNNAVIVYNGATGLVEGYDTFPEPFRIDDMAVTLYNQQRRLFALDKDAGRIYVMYEGKSDFVYDPETDLTTENEIQDLIETRGYATLGWNAATRRDFKQVQIGISTWAPSITVTELTESANDERALNQNAITKSRTQYDTLGRKDWVATNSNDDWDTPGRQDYSITADETGFLVDGDGIDPDQKQASTLRFSTKARGKYISYRIANNQGNADVGWILVESSGTQREPRRGG